MNFFFTYIGGWIRFGVLEVEVILLVLAELRCSNVHSDFNLTGVASLLDGYLEQLQTLYKQFLVKKPVFIKY